MESYHYAWLALHPARSEAWLAARLADGFHVHHLDGNHANDEPSNLALVEGEDHMRLHGMLRPVRPAKRLASPTDAVCYQERAKGKAWGKIEANTDKPRFTRELANRNGAARYAREHGLPWPIPKDIARSMT